MNFKAEIDIMPMQEILDPQGKAVKLGLKNLGQGDIADVRIGKHISMKLAAANKDDATKQVDEACKKLLANLIMETYSFELEQV